MPTLPTGTFTPPGVYAMIEQRDGQARLLLDVTLSEEHAFENEVTEYPVESGGTVSDNIRQKPIRVTIEGLVSNTPLDPMATLRGEDAVDTAAETAFGYLMGIYTARDTLTLRTSLGTFRDMALESLTIPRSRETGDALRFNATFKQISFVTNKRVRTATRNTGGRKKLGAKPLSQLDPKTVLWRKGVAYDSTGQHYYVGGAPITRESETVHWIPNAFPYDLGFSTLGYDPANPDGVWFHSDKSTPLTRDEKRRLLLDLRRDLGPSPGVQIDYDTAKNKTKSPIDVNATNKRPVFKFPTKGRNAA